MPSPAAALVREPSPRLHDAELTFRSRAPVDLARAREQHAGYLDLLRGRGLEVILAPALSQHPDGVFVEDAVVVVDHLAILTRSGAVSRRGEVDSLRATLADRGLQVVELAAPATLDGGDVLQVGPTIFVGRTTRTDAAGIAQLRSLVAPLGREVVAVDVGGALHLKTAATALPDGRILANLDAVAAGAFGDLEVAGPEETSGANLLLLGSTVVVAASAPRTAARLRADGYDVATVELSEFEKVEAGPTCLSVLLPDR